jgi:hypothetical protein
MTTQQETQTLEQTLEKTDFGHWVNERKKSIMVIGAVILVTIISYSVVNHMNTSKKADLLNKIHEIKTVTFTPYIEGKQDAATLLTNIGKVQNEFISNIGLIPSFLEALNTMSTKAELTAEHMAVASTWLSKMNKEADDYLFFGVRVAALYEDLLNVDASLALLTNLASRNSDLLKDQVYFNLGRLNITKGNIDSAKANFDIVISKYPSSDFASLAKIYKGRL